jgi:hypothetical protein
MESEDTSPPSQNSPFVSSTEPTSRSLHSQNLFLLHSFHYFTPAYAQVLQVSLRRRTFHLTSRTKCTADINATKYVVLSSLFLSP